MFFCIFIVNKGFARKKENKQICQIMSKGSQLRWRQISMSSNINFKSSFNKEKVWSRNIYVGEICRALNNLRNPTENSSIKVNMHKLQQFY